MNSLPMHFNEFGKTLSKKEEEASGQPLDQRQHPIVQQKLNEWGEPCEGAECYDLVNPQTFDEVFYLIDAFNVGFRI